MEVTLHNTINSVGHCSILKFREKIKVKLIVRGKVRAICPITHNGSKLNLKYVKNLL